MHPFYVNLVSMDSSCCAGYFKLGFVPIWPIFREIWAFEFGVYDG